MEGVARRVPAPSEFMRARRPELFSDSIDRDELILDRARLEFHLDSMTSRSEEKQFEHYCRQLCEREICPHLRPQTGPTGGGDSKVDSDTYPVAKAVSDRWYVGDADAKGAADLAFAFSAMKDFARKVRADVKSIASTKRAYARIYFVSNQWIADKRKGSLEAELRKQHGIPVTILDRTWLVEKTLNRRNLDVAVSTLGLRDLERERRKSTGVHDFAREKRLKELEEHLADLTYYGGGYQLVKDAIDAALVDRGLGSPQADVRGKFERAIRLADKHGGKSQQMRARYLWIWTAYWWFDDVAALREGFLSLVNQYVDEATVWDQEFLVNLDVAIAGSTIADGFVRSAEHVDARERVRRALSKVARLKSAPTQVLWAQTLQIFMRMPYEIRSGLRQETTRELRRILERAKGLPEYPIETLLNWTTQLLEIAADDPEVLQLADEVAGVTSARAGVSAQVDLRLKLAARHVERDEPYAALEQFGRAQQALREHVDIADQAWLWTLSAAAYDRAGLNWARRSCLLCAVASGFSTFRRQREMPQHLPVRVRRLLWADIELGNLPAALNWYEMWNLLRRNVPTPDDERAYHEMERALQAAFALAPLRSTDEDLQRLGALPEIFRAVGLHFPAEFALAALGHADDVATGVGSSTADVWRTCASLLAQPIAAQLPLSPRWRVGEPVEIETRVMGCRVRLLTDGDRESVLFAEGFAGFLEAMLALGPDRRIFAKRDEIVITLTHDTGERPGLSWEVRADDCGEEQVFVRLAGSAADDAVLDPNRWAHIAIEIALRILAFPDDETMNSVLGPSGGSADRAMSLVGLPRMIDNLLGTRFPHDSTWAVQLQAALGFAAKYWPFTRSSALNELLPPIDSHPAPEEVAPEYLAHNALSTSGLVNVDLWRQAGWRGFLYTQWAGQPPILGIMFEDHEAGRKLFRGWRRRLGEVDEQERLVLGVMTGVNGNEPNQYRAVITEDFTFEPGVRVASRPCVRMTLTPGPTSNLPWFKQSLTDHGHYLVVPMMLDLAKLEHIDPGQLPEHLEMSLALRKSRFDVVAAWEVGRGSRLMMGFMPGDAPVVPAGVTNPPYVEMLAAVERSAGSGS